MCRTGDGMSANNHYTFRDFILDEMQKRGMKSARQFALFIGVDPTTISRAIDAQKPTKPGLDLLIKIAESTKTDMSALFAIAYPDVTIQTAASPDALIMAQSIEKLPQSTKDAVRALIRGQVA
jgi:hypothetical protein